MAKKYLFNGKEYDLQEMGDIVIKYLSKMTKKFTEIQELCKEIKAKLGTSPKDKLDYATEFSLQMFEELEKATIDKMQKENKEYDEAVANKDFEYVLREFGRLIVNEDLMFQQADQAMDELVVSDESINSKVKEKAIDLQITVLDHALNCHQKFTDFVRQYVEENASENDGAQL